MYIRSVVGKKDEYFRYLFNHEDSFETNWYDAVPYLEMEWGLDETEAKNILLEWLENYEIIAKRLKIKI